MARPSACACVTETRVSLWPRSKAYGTKRTGGTKANLDILRRLKRYTAREHYPLIVEALSRRTRSRHSRLTAIEASVTRV
jgi:hypothetical protein